MIKKKQSFFYLTSLAFYGIAKLMSSVSSHFVLPKNERGLRQMNSVSSEIKRFCHSKGQNWYHVTLVPKGRFPVFQWKQLRDLAEEAFRVVCKNHSIDLFAIEVMDDHVHLFVSCPPDFSIRRLFQILKGASSHYIRERYTSLKKYKHLWNRGTMYRSVGDVSSETVKHYIEKSNSWSANRQKKLFD